MSTKPGGRPVARKVTQYAADLQAVVATVTDDAVRLGCQPGPLGNGNDGYKITLVPLWLRTVDEPIRFLFGQLVEAASEEHIHGFTVTGYWYGLLNRLNQPMMRFEWDPRQDPMWPHLHVDQAGLDVVGDGEPVDGQLSIRLFGGVLDKLHVPTGRVLLEDILRFLVRDNVIDPRTGFDDAVGTSLEWVDAATWGTSHQLMKRLEDDGT